MPKDYSAPFLAALEADNLSYFLLIEVFFDDTTIRVTTLPYGVNISYGGYTWEGLSNLLEVSDISESADITTDGFSVSLSGLDNDYIDRAMSEYYQGRTLNLYHGIMDSAGVYTVEPKLLASGIVDNQTIALGDTSTILITVRPHISKVIESIEERYTDEDQRSKYPDDTGLRLVSSIPNKQYSWGSFVSQKGYLLQRM